MPANTPRLTLPFPIPDDTVDVPRDVKALADTLDALTSINPPLVTTLPPNPNDGDEIAFDVGPMWSFRYNAATGEWDFIGGSPIIAGIGALESYSAVGVWHDLATPGPQITVPLTGNYEIEYWAEVSTTPTAAFQWGIAPQINANPTIDPALLSGPSAAGAQVLQDLRWRNVTTLTTGDTITLKYYVSGYGASFRARYLQLLPRQVKP